MRPRYFPSTASRNAHSSAVRSITLDSAVPAPWPALAAALPALVAARDRPADFAEARALLQPFTDAAAAVSIQLAVERGLQRDATASVLASALLAQRLLDGDAGAVPLQASAQLGTAASAADLRDESAAALLRQWPSAAGVARGERIQLALLAARLRASLRGNDPARPLPAWRVLAIAWRAARPAPTRSIPPA